MVSSNLSFAAVRAFGIASLVVLMIAVFDGCYTAPTRGETASMELFQIRYFCKPSLGQSSCDSGQVTYSRVGIALWSDFIPTVEDRRKHVMVNGRPLEEYRDIHGGRYTLVLADPVPDSAIFCDGRPNVLVVPAYHGMPGIIDSIRTPVAISLLAPATFDTVSRVGFEVRWIPVPGRMITILMYGFPSTKGMRTWTVDASNGSLMISEHDLIAFDGGQYCLISLRFEERASGVAGGRPYDMRCLCNDDHTVWLE